MITATPEIGFPEEIINDLFNESMPFPSPFNHKKHKKSRHIRSRNIRKQKHIGNDLGDLFEQIFNDKSNLFQFLN